MNLNRPSIKSGPLTLADLQEARRAKLQNISLAWPPRRASAADTAPADREADAQPDDTESGALDEGPALLASFVGPLLIVAAAAACALFLAWGWPMAWLLG